jgi:hypothetical protein
MRWIRRTALVLLVVPGAWLLWGIADRVHALRALPDGTGGWFVTYAENNTFGFGPGGNETGLNVVLLTAAGAARIKAGGTAWLDQQEGGRIAGAWSETPVPDSETWRLREDHAMGRLPSQSILAHLNRYGFGIHVPDRHLTAIDRALNQPGSFYAFGDDGLLVLFVPDTHRAYVAYAG